MKKNSIYNAGLILVFLFFIGTAARAIHSRIQLNKGQHHLAQLKKQAGAFNPVVSSSPTVRLEAQISRLARTAGVRRLLRVSSKPTRHPHQQHLHMEWEASLPATFQFLETLGQEQAIGPCLTLQVSNHPTQRRHVRARGVFESGSFVYGAVERSTSSVSPRLKRNVFASLWRVPQKKKGPDPQLAWKKREEKRQREQERLQQERQQREQQKRRQAKKRELQTQLVLTGIVNNGREPLAFVKEQGAQEKTLMIREGDFLREARVTRIDESRQEVKLDYDGQFQVNLRLP